MSVLRVRYTNPRTEFCYSEYPLIEMNNTPDIFLAAMAETWLLGYKAAIERIVDNVGWYVPDTVSFGITDNDGSNWRPITLGGVI